MATTTEETATETRGRKPHIPTSLIDHVLQLHTAGNGYRKISSLLREIGVIASRASVSRCIRGESPYDRE